VSERLPKLEKMIYDERGGCATTTTPNLHEIGSVIADGRTALKEDSKFAAFIERRDRGREGLRYSIILYTSGPPANRRAWCCRASAASAGSDTVAFDKAHRTRRGDGLSAARLVGDHYLNYAQAWWRLSAWLVRRTPTAMADLARSGRASSSRRPGPFEQMLTAG